MKRFFSLLLFPLLFFSGCSQSSQVSYQLIPPKNGDKVAYLRTNFGEIHIKLFPEKVPETIKNFETLANSGYYDGTIFHRVIKDFMIQGGDPTGTGRGGDSYKGPGTKISEEFDKELTHIYGALSMAKTSEPNTTGSQFFIVQNKSGTHHLDNLHSVFGQVYQGLDTLERIAQLPVSEDDRPLQDAVVFQARVLSYGE